MNGWAFVSCAIACSLAAADRPVNRNAQTGRGLDQLAVLRADSRQARLVPLDQSSFVRDTEISTRSRNRLVNPRLTTVDDNQVRAVPSKQPTYYLLCQLRAGPDAGRRRLGYACPYSISAAFASQPANEGKSRAVSPLARVEAMFIFANTVWNGT